MILLACGLLCLSVPSVLISMLMAGDVLTDKYLNIGDMAGPLFVLLCSLGATTLAILSLCLG